MNKLLAFFKNWIVLISIAGVFFVGFAITLSAFNGKMLESQIMAINLSCLGLAAIFMVAAIIAQSGWKPDLRFRIK